MPSVDVRARRVAAPTLFLARDEKLIAAGISERTVRRRVADTAWDRVAPRLVDVVRGSWSWERRVLSAVLAGPPGTLASHATAAALHQLGGLRAPTPIEVTVPRPYRWVELRARVHSTLDPAHGLLIGAVPTTPIPRTLRDLSIEGSSRLVQRAVRDVLRRGVTGVTELMAESDGTHPGCARLRIAVERELAGDGHRLESFLEDEWYDVLRAASLPDFAVQRRIELGDGKGVRVDIAWPEQMVALEIDGAAWHADALATAHDRERHLVLTALGWRLLRVTAADLRPDRLRVLLARLARMLAAT